MWNFSGGGDHGGGTVVPSNAVEMNLTDMDGGPAYFVTLGDQLKLTIRVKELDRGKRQSPQSSIVLSDCCRDLQRCITDLLLLCGPRRWTQ